MLNQVQVVTSMIDLWDVILEWTTSLDSSAGTLIARHSVWVSTLRRK